MKVPIGRRPGQLDARRRAGRQSRRPRRPAFTITNGRRLVTHVTNGALLARGLGPRRRRSSPRCRARAEVESRRRRRADSDPAMAATTREMPAATMRSTHGPVRPVWRTARACSRAWRPRARAPAASSATTSACGPPARGARPARRRRRPATRPRRRPSDWATSVRGRARPGTARAP